VNVDNTAPDVLNIWNDVATTGEDVGVSIIATDLTEVRSIHLNYSFNGGPEVSVVPFFTGNDTWVHSISVPSNATTMSYRFWLEDRLGNGHFSNTVNVDVIDNDLPWIDTDSTPTLATTDDELIFAVNATDNIGILRINLEYWYEGDLTHLWGTANADELEHTVIVRNSLETLYYFFRIYDTSGNELIGSIVSIPVIDNDKPVFGVDSSDTEATTGEVFTFNLQVTDNVELVQVRLIYWFGTGTAENVSIANVTDKRWMHEISIPDDSIEPLNYRFEAVDSSTNWNITVERAVDVVDNDLPFFGDDQTPTGATTGEEFTFAVYLYDNIDVMEADIVYKYGSGVTTKVILIEGEADIWEATITIEDTLDDLTYEITVVDTSGNLNNTLGGSVEITDNDLPVILDDSTAAIATTGDVFEFQVMVLDNIAVGSAEVVYTFEGNTPVKTTLEVVETLVNGSVRYSLAIDIHHRGLAPLSYHFVVVDTSSNTYVSTTKSVTVLDNDSPEIYHDQKETEALKGLRFTFGIIVEDNIRVTDMHMVLRYGSDPTQNLTMTRSLGIRIPIEVPRHASGDMTYYFSATDEAGNWNSTVEYILVLKNAAPKWNNIPLWSITEEQNATLDLWPYLSDANDDVTSLSVKCDDPSITVNGLKLKARYDEVVDDWTIKLTVSDGEDETEIDVDVHIVNVNDVPQVVSIFPENGTKYGEGKKITFTVSATDEEGDDLTVTWISDGKTLGTGSTLDYKKLKPGTRVVKVSIFDGTDTTEEEFTLIIKKEEESPSAGVMLALLALIIGTAVFMRWGRKE